MKMIFDWPEFELTLDGRLIHAETREELEEAKDITFVSFRAAEAFIIRENIPGSVL